MAVHIRLARHGTNKTPFYRIVVADQRSPRGGRFIERVGTYNPQRDELRVDTRRIDHWLSHGAQPTHTVAKLIKAARAAAGAPAAAGTPAAAAPAAVTPAGSSS
jgi:small subunit ribosomal protein S16